MKMKSIWSGAAVVAGFGLLMTGSVFAQSVDNGRSVPEAEARGANFAGRSAFSDCEREASRRGYAIVSSGNYRQYRDGWALDMRARDNAGRETTATCFVQGNTGQVSITGLGYGNIASGQTVQFNCASLGSAYQECQLPIDGTVRLVQTYSASRCDEGSTWGQKGDRIWVDRGCRAAFEVSGNSGGSTSRVDCRSNGNRYTECQTTRGYLARLDQDMSGNRCANNNWGTSNGVVWVRNGCQARFTLESVDGSSSTWNTGSSGTAARVESQCVDVARDRGLNVRNVLPARNLGLYWESMVEGTERGGTVRMGCRYYPANARIDVNFNGGSWQRH